jgi:hypothetical protein
MRQDFYTRCRGYDLFPERTKLIGVGRSCSERSDPHGIDCEECCLVGFDAVRFCLVMVAVCGVAPRKAKCLRNSKDRT